MKHLKNIAYIIIGAFIAVAVMRWIPATAQEKATPPRIISSDKPLSRDVKAATSFAPMVKRVGPSVVNIFTTKKVRVNPRGQMGEIPDFFRWFMPEGQAPGGDEDESESPAQPRSRIEQSLGSGVIVSENGYILSNNHVVEGADEIRVVLLNGEEYIAKVVGTDPPTDTAVLKIDAGSSLPAITLANSDHVEIGDAALAVGNPFGLGQTVTSGIVSAVGRGGFGIVDYEDFIQTDASINQGNSGGALIDAEGRLIGINTFIMSRSGGNQGIGFAIPVNMARGVMDRLIEEGKVRRGYLGVQLQTELSAELAEAFQVPNSKGALISDVPEATPAQKAGIKAGDVITEFNGKPVGDSRHLRLMVAQSKPGSKAKLTVSRGGKNRSVDVTLGELPTTDMATNLRPSRPQEEEPESPSETLEGVTVTDITPRLRRELRLPQSAKGPLIVEVDPESNAYREGVRKGDIIQEINRQPVTNADDAVALAEKNTSGRILLRLYSPLRGSRYVTVKRAE